MTRSNFASQYRAGVVNLLNNLAALRDMELQYNAEAIGSSLVQGDLVGSNADLTPAQFIAAVGSREAIETLLSANGNAHYTNLMLMRP